MIWSFIVQKEKEVTFHTYIAKQLHRRILHPYPTVLIVSIYIPRAESLVWTQLTMCATDTTSYIPITRQDLSVGYSCSIRCLFEALPKVLERRNIIYILQLLCLRLRSVLISKLEVRMLYVEHICYT